MAVRTSWEMCIRPTNAGPLDGELEKAGREMRYGREVTSDEMLLTVLLLPKSFLYWGSSESMRIEKWELKGASNGAVWAAGKHGSAGRHKPDLYHVSMHKDVKQCTALESMVRWRWAGED